jgi:hypothetical protein
VVCRQSAHYPFTTASLPDCGDTAGTPELHPITFEKLTFRVDRIVVPKSATVPAIPLFRKGSAGIPTPQRCGTPKAQKVLRSSSPKRASHRRILSHSKHESRQRPRESYEKCKLENKLKSICCEFRSRRGHAELGRLFSPGPTDPGSRFRICALNTAQFADTVIIFFTGGAEM